MAKLVGGIFLAPVVLLAGALVVGTVFASLTGWTSAWDEDAATMRQTNDRLTYVAASLEPLRVGGRAAMAERHGCTTSSGDLFQPRHDMRWPTEAADAQDEAKRVETILETWGWRITDRHERMGHIALERTFGEWTTHAYLGWTQPDEVPAPGHDPGLTLSVKIVGARPCSPA